MKKRVKLSIIGCGRIFKKHFFAIQKLSNQFILESVCDTNKKNISKLNLPKRIKVFYSIQELLDNTNSDIYIILTPSGFHYKNIFQIGKKFKNIIVEKPLVLNFDQAKKVAKFAKKRKLNLIVVKQNRYNLAIQKLKQAINKKRFGKIFLGTIRLRWKRDESYFKLDKWRGTWRLDGGVLANQASHHVDLIHWLIGDISSVFTKTLKINKATKAVDTLISVLKFKNGAMGLIEATTATQPKDLEGSISILGTKGTVEIGGFAVSKVLTWKFVKKLPIDKKINQYSRLYKNVYGFGHLEFYKDIYCFFNKKKNTIIKYKEGIKSIQLIDKIYASAEKSREIFINDKEYSDKLGK